MTEGPLKADGRQYFSMQRQLLRECHLDSHSCLSGKSQLEGIVQALTGPKMKTQGVSAEKFQETLLGKVQLPVPVCQKSMVMAKMMIRR